jgi:hypothetical protein
LLINRAFTLDYRVEAWGLLLSFLGTILGLVTLHFALVFFTGARRLGMDASAVFSDWFHIQKVQPGVEWRIGETSITLIEGVPSALTCLHQLSHSAPFKPVFVQG